MLNVIEETPDRLGRWFARYGTDGVETFSARLFEAKAELGIAWTSHVGQLAENIAVIQGILGCDLVKITGMATLGIETVIMSARFNSDLYSRHLARHLGGEWRIELLERPGEDVWDIVARRIGE